MQDLVDTNKQVTDELQKYRDELNKKLTKHDSDLDKIKILLKQVLVQNQTPLPENMDEPKVQYPTTVFTANKKASTLKGGNYTKNGVMWTLKHEISSPKFYELLIKT